MKQLVIDRSKWRTGGIAYDATHGDTHLLNAKGYMCCLGFYCVQLGGVDKRDIYEIGCPEDLNDVNAYNDDIFHLVNEDNLRDTSFTQKAIDINDSEKLTNEEREKNIQEHFKQIDVEVVFTNDYNQ